MSTPASHLQLDDLSAALLDAFSGAVAIIDEHRHVLAANDAWTDERLTAVGSALPGDDALSSVLERAGNEPSVTAITIGGMSCRARVQPLPRNLTLVQVDIQSDIDEFAQLGEAMERVLRQFPVIYFRLDEHGVFTESIGAGLANLGLNDRDAVGWNAYDAYPQVADQLKRAMRGEAASYIAEGEHDGRKWAYRTYVSPDFDQGGVLGIALDVTEQFEVREALLTSEALLREVADQVPGVVYSYDTMPDGTRKTRFMGSGLESLLGEEIAGRVTESTTPLFERIAPEGMAQILQVRPKSIDLEIPIDLEYEMRTDDGRWVWVRNVVRSVRLPDGRVRNTGVLMDVTEKHRAEHALRESRELLARTQELANIGGWKHDATTGEVAWTDQLFDILGVPRGTTPSLDLILEKCDKHSEQILRDASTRELAIGESCDLELTIFRTPDDRRTIRLTGQAQMENHKPSMLWGTIQDVTRERALEMELRHAQKMEAVGQLASGIAHEFNNLISTVSGHVDIAQQSLDRDSLAVESLDHVAEAMERAFGLARGLLAFSRKAAPKRELVDIGMVVDQAERLLRRTIPKRIDLDVRPQFGLWTHADAAQILQVVLNLAINARDAMPEGGMLTIEVEGRDDQVSFSISDTGEGIPAPLMSRIFEPFFTTKPSDLGTGLGLALSRGIIEEHDGRIEATSTVGRGSTFRVDLPAASKVEQRPEAPKHRRRAVLAESQPFARSLLTTLLGEHGFEVRMADSARQALESPDGADLVVVSCYDGDTDLPESLPTGPQVILITGMEQPAPAGLRGGVSILRRPFRSSDVSRLLSADAEVQ